jgi:hypothetical protein
MIIEFNPDDYEVKSTYYVCPFHQKNPLKHYAGCGCSSSYSLVKKGKPTITLTEKELRLPA